MAIQTAKAVQTAVRVTVRLTTTAIKALIALIEEIITAIAAGGWVAVVIIVVIAAIIAVLMFAFGIFFTEEVENNPSIVEVTATVESTVRSKMDEVARRVDADRGVIEQDGDGDIIQNWRDIFAVYAVKMTTDPENGML